MINLEGLPIPFELNSEIFTAKLSYLAPNFPFLPTIISILLTFFSSFSSFFSLQFSLFVLTIYTLLEIKLNISIVHVLQGCSPQMTTPPKMIIYIDHLKKYVFSVFDFTIDLKGKGWKHQEIRFFGLPDNSCRGNYSLNRIRTNGGGGFLINY